MDIDRIIDNVCKEVIEENKKKTNDLAGKEKTASDHEKKTNFFKTKQELSISDLCHLEIIGEEEEEEIYKRILQDAETFIDSFTDSPRCKDSNAEKGMYKCSHDTWEYCIRLFSMDYFKKYKLVHDVRRERKEGGYRFREQILKVGLEVYETLCEVYRKVFQIYDVCLFLGINKDNMYKLSEMHSNFLKKAHSATENSLRIGAVSGRGNVAGYALLLNHDYEYTKTTQIIHTSNTMNITADKLPTLEHPQDIVVSGNEKQNQINGDMM